MAAPQIFRFMDLPVEIRIIIYEHASNDTTVHSVAMRLEEACIPSAFPYSMSFVVYSFNTALIRTCKRICSEAAPIMKRCFTLGAPQFMFEPASTLMADNVFSTLLDFYKGLQQGANFDLQYKMLSDNLTLQPSGTWSLSLHVDNAKLGSFNTTAFLDRSEARSLLKFISQSGLSLLDRFNKGEMPRIHVTYSASAGYESMATEKLEDMDEIAQWSGVQVIGETLSKSFAWSQVLEQNLQACETDLWKCLRAQG